MPIWLAKRATRREWSVWWIEVGVERRDQEVGRVREEVALVVVVLGVAQGDGGERGQGREHGRRAGIEGSRVVVPDRERARPPVAHARRESPRRGRA